MNLDVIYSAAHAEFPDTEPLGGGKAVADFLVRQWQRTHPFPLTLLSPRSMGMLDGTHPCPSQDRTPKEISPPPEGPGVGSFRLLLQPLTDLSELEYARFCRQFERATTGEILKHDPTRCIMLSNDISEGPDFGTLGERGYRIVTIFHVDVVEYFTRFYLRNLVPPERVAKFRWFGVIPDVLRLVIQKQYECVRHSTRIVVPSAPMKEMIRRCYPWCQTDKITVLPWGNISVAPVAPTLVSGLLQLPKIGEDEFVVLTLSRLSPEKGIERLLAALPRVTPNGKLRVFICGGAAYMKGRAYEQKLRRLAAKTTNARVDFTGHVTGEQKAALLQRADLFISPSRHESYGLTIAEAEAAGCRVISHNHYGAGGTVVDCSDPATLAAAINALVATGRTQKTPAASSPSGAAEQLAKLLSTVANVGAPFRARPAESRAEARSHNPI